MDFDSALDPQQAATILAALECKKEDECRYPTCDQKRQVTPGTGRPSAYCSNSQHNPVTNSRARKQLRMIASGRTTLPEISSKQDFSSALVAISPLESLRNSVVGQITLLQANLEKYLTALAEMADPDLVSAQIKATLDKANAQVTEAQQRVSTEVALRLAAEAALLTAQQETQAEREAAELAIQRMDEAEQRIKVIQAERDETVAQIQAEMQCQLVEQNAQAQATIAQIQSALVQAQEELRREQARAHEGELLAQAQIQAAEQRLAEVKESLERERREIDRLRAELAAVVVNARADLERGRAETREQIARERKEVDRLWSELAAERTRADRLANHVADLQKQILANREKPVQESDHV